MAKERTDMESAIDLISGTSEIDFPVVGIGASAGGLSSFQSFFSGLEESANPRMSFIIVQHLAPEHKSSLTELIRKCTSLNVYEVQNDMPVQINSVYVIPPAYNLLIEKGKLKLIEADISKGHHLSIDLFFRSLADECHEKAICIILSGSGSDGSIGLRAIKGKGGMVMVQKPESAEFSSMPGNAISTGLVDFVLSPEEMAVQLQKYASFNFEISKEDSEEFESLPYKEVKHLFLLLKNQIGHDFSQYKSSTIMRRIKRRMAIKEIKTLKEYIDFTRESSEEVESLFYSLLIGVTNFFRDTGAFAYLEKEVIPGIIRNKENGSPLRIWVPGCSTGEEAYSIAILFYEYMYKANLPLNTTIFATDIDPLAIDRARSGMYPYNIKSEIKPEILNKYFNLEPDGRYFRISKKIRDLLVFSEQNLIKDPPFSKIDLISCRNLLIYMGPELQRKIIPIFHYALNPEGFLFLGTSESIGENGKLFKKINNKQKIYRRKDGFIGNRNIKIDNFLPDDNSARKQVKTNTTQKGMALKDLTEKALLQNLSHAAVLVNSTGDIFYLYGRTGRFLEPSPGVQGIPNVLKMAREGLYQKLPGLLRKTVKTGKILTLEGLMVRTNGDFEKIDIKITPVKGKDNSSESDYYLIILERNYKTSPKDISSSGESLSGSRGSIESLQQELTESREFLQSTQEELKAANEELKSSNEEMQSVNEELQSTNEELETSKEELQSVNEELITVNTELQMKVRELTRLNNDMDNLLAGTGIGTIFVDFQLCIMRFTPTVTKIINLINGDIGRPVNHILSNFKSHIDLVPLIQSVLDDLSLKEMEVETIDGTWYSMCIQPYRTLDNVIEGAVITFADISNAKRIEEKLINTESLFHNFFTNSPVAISLFKTNKNGKLCLIDANPSIEKISGKDPASLVGLTFNEIFPWIKNDKVSEILTAMAEGFSDDLTFSESFSEYEVRAFKMSDQTIGVEIVKLPNRP
ncbi:chemotaxis protein CheB [Spirochaeta isovalerica]|uniref:Two-component system CheB/CheR fusion protein n=1 Tax=Spirochaeta isovalerica TaxID=150 RepID=A0A841R463_9SPIO|nr:chemotaxis protein CheB [Spirochaeta isovalerica]MBB6479894.1 two-component system CheB/CheR fusion protein [Spirochaeta isovalerica]